MSTKQLSENGSRRDPVTYGIPNLPIVKVSREQFKALDLHKGRAILDVRAWAAENTRRASLR